MQRRLSILPMLFVLAIACFSNAADNVPMEVLHKAAHITPSLQQLAWQEMEFTRYTGADKIAGHERYALEYGPILMAVVGPLDKDLHVTIPHDPKEIAKWLKPKADRPLCFAIEGDTEHEYMPYWQINNQKFCVYPVIESNAAAK